MPVVLDDLDFDYSPTVTDTPSDAKHKLSAAISKVIILLLRSAVAKCMQTEIRLISQPREGKKLLVLDIDHTIMDFKNSNLTLQGTHPHPLPPCANCYAHRNDTTGAGRILGEQHLTVNSLFIFLLFYAGRRVCTL